MVMNRSPRTIAAGLAGGLAGFLLGATAFIAVNVLMPSTARAVDYVKCEAINKAYGRQMHGMNQAIEEQGHLFDHKSKDPVGGVAWDEATTRVAMPYQEKINLIVADYEAAGCP